jgi:hypothetical protein
MKTIQMIIGGKWINLSGHGCKTDQDFINYVSLGPAIMRIADDSTHGATVYQEDILETQILVAQNEIEGFDDTPISKKPLRKEAVDIVIAVLRGEEPVFKDFFEEVPCKGCGKGLLVVPNPIYGGLCFDCNEAKSL